MELPLAIRECILLKGHTILHFHTGTWDKTVDMSDFGPSHIINIKKEKRETDEETKQILRMLEKDDVSVRLTVLETTLLV